MIIQADVLQSNQVIWEHHDWRLVQLAKSTEYVLERRGNPDAMGNAAWGKYDFVNMRIDSSAAAAIKSFCESLVFVGEGGKTVRRMNLGGRIAK